MAHDSSKPQCVQVKQLIAQADQDGRVPFLVVKACMQRACASPKDTAAAQELCSDRQALEMLYEELARSHQRIAELLLQQHNAKALVIARDVAIQERDAALERMTELEHHIAESMIIADEERGFDTEQEGGPCTPRSEGLLQPIPEDRTMQSLTPRSAEKYWDDSFNAEGCGAGQERGPPPLQELEPCQYKPPRTSSIRGTMILPLPYSTPDNIVLRRALTQGTGLGFWTTRSSSPVLRAAHAALQSRTECCTISGMHPRQAKQLLPQM